MKSKRKVKTSRYPNYYKKQDVEDTIVTSFNQFVDKYPKGGNIFELLNMVFMGLKKLDVPSAVADLKPATESKEDLISKFEEELREAATKA